MSQVQGNSKSKSFVKECIEKYRSKLLDMSKNNNLISFNHNERFRHHIRVIDELPDLLYKNFSDGKVLKFLALLEEDQIPPDEKTDTFSRRLKQVKLTKEYIDAVTVAKDDTSKIRQIERDLRNKIRKEQNLTVWKEYKNLTNAEIAKKHGLNPDYEMLESTPKNQGAARHVDESIQILLTPEKMAGKLRGLNSFIRSDIEESGTNTLYAAFGFLQWYESKNSDKHCVSPLLLLQLEIKKKQSKEGYTYTVQAIGEEPEFNLSLSERFKKDGFGIEFPELTEVDGLEERYMAKVADCIKNAKNLPKKEEWRVRRFITIGRFRFARLVMFHDLSEEKWPKDTDVSTSEVIKNLLAGSKNTSDNGHADDYDIDTLETEKSVPMLITHADASQHSALIDVMEGKNLVIKGPPGTGKSQTITNIIANVLKEGKTVLFLAEKMAALNVVHKRLRNANLGPYCLELHSTKAKKTEVLKSIKERLDIDSLKENVGFLDETLKKFKNHVSYNTKYTDVLNSKFGRQDKTIHNYLWTLVRLRDQIGDLHSTLSQITIPFEKADMKESEFKAHKDEFQSLVLLKETVNSEFYEGRHPWAFVENSNLSPFHHDELRQLSRCWKEQLEKMKDILKSFSKDFDLKIDPYADALGKFLYNTKDLARQKINDLDQDVVANLGGLKQAEALVAFIGNIHTYRSAQKDVSVVIKKDVLAAITKIEEIEEQAKVAKELGIDGLKIRDIRKLKLEKKLKLWEKYLPKLLDIGKEHFGVSKDDDIAKFYSLAEVLDNIASVPKYCLHFRKKAIIDKSNAKQLKEATDTRRLIRKQRAKRGIDRDLSVEEQPCDIHTYAKALGNSGWFACLYPSYRKAKKFYPRVSKCGTKFNANKASKTLWMIASTMEKCQKIDQDKQLKDICGSFFKGSRTNFKKLQKTNEWGSKVRKHYAAKDTFIVAIREWILTAKRKVLSSVRALARDDKFALKLKDKIACIKKADSNACISPDTPFEEYLESLVNRVKKLSSIRHVLQDIAASKNVTFADITKILPRLKKAREAKMASEEEQTVKSLFGNRYAGADTDVQDIEKTACFINDFLAVPEMQDSSERFLNKDFSKIWRDFIENRTKVNAQYKVLCNKTKETPDKSRINLSAIFDTGDWKSVPYEDLIELFKNALTRPDSLDSWCALDVEHTKISKNLKSELLAVYDEKKSEL